MNEDQLLACLPGLLHTYWGLDDPAVAPLGGGMNSLTALVDLDHQRWVAKWVRTGGRPGLRRSADIAARLAAGGMRSGRPLPTHDSTMTIEVGGGSLVMLEYVPGRDLTDQADDQVVQGKALARAHTLLGTSVRRAEFFPWLGDPRIQDAADWVLPAIKRVRAEYRALPPITWGTLHADPNTDAFLLDESTGEVGIIDWSGAGDGPLLYDIASAVMYLGGPEKATAFLDAYGQSAPLPVDELAQRLHTFRRFRAIVQADYFAHRILDNDLTGIDTSAENDEGLGHARQLLEELDVI